jgi:NAD(P)-dependent dehydrogenase (short-subunit alcohol dehydrogenase family)
MNSGQDDQVAVVTGATGAIGKAIARGLAGAGFEVVVIGRDETRTREAVKDIRSSTGNNRVRFELVDLSRHSAIRALADRWEGPLHVLINNAAVTPRKRVETPEGIELQMATNILGYFWMTQELRQPLAGSAPARVINVASYWAGDLELDDLEFRRRRYSNGRAYRQSKQANRMLSAAFAERLQSLKISVNACHPGDVNSKLSNDLGFGGVETPDQGADTPVWLATSGVGQDETGKYFEGRRAVPDRFVTDCTAVEALFQACLVYP